MNVQEKVIAILEEQLGLPKGEVLLKSTKESLGMDSLDEIETIMALEEEFDIEINDYHAAKFKSVQDIVDFIKATQLCNTMSTLAYNDAKEVFSEVYKSKSIHDVATETSHPLSYTYEQLEGKDLVAHKDGYMHKDKSLFCKKGNTYKIDTLSGEELSFIDESGDNHYWDLYGVGEYFYPVEKLKDDLYNPVKDISYKKYLRCTDRLPAKMFNSDQGCLWMYKSSCGKYYYWAEYNCANRVIYRREEVDWVESNYGEYSVEDENIVEINDFAEEFSSTISSLDTTKRTKLEGTKEEKKETLLKEVIPTTEWTDKHYDFNYTLTENDIENGVIKIDPYFVADQWKLGEKDNSGVIFHILKTCSRYKTKHEEEREIKAIHGQIKRLAEIRGVELK
jgi:acyl carrier protein|tara:strand:- start:2966 stop:4144 length:1179 start_codon:yes stop_codon:yes gene_type:complete